MLKLSYEFEMCSKNQVKNDVGVGATWGRYKEWIK